MTKKEIKLSDLFYIIDKWFDSNLSPVIKVEIKNSITKEGSITFGKYIPEYMKGARPTHFYLNTNEEIQIDKITALEYDDCHYIIVKG
ncbi:MAG: hypothetical protein IKK05_05010 [Alistipes sp.]|nr:hypothetical protein [Alistipes sp.]